MDIRASIRTFLAGLMRANGYEGELRDDQSLVQAGVLDSLSILMLLAYLNETFGTVLDGDAVDPRLLDSVEAIEAFVRARTLALS
ncbi:MAG TPA: hypothetical protein VNL98_12315 [Gemmatimonadales bacterium]|nr:hypothetical protein [Gemmatimonadales bacterium]